MHNFKFCIELTTLFFVFLIFSFFFYLLLIQYEIKKNFHISSLFKSILLIVKNKKLKKKYYASGKYLDPFLNNTTYLLIIILSLYQGIFIIFVNFYLFLARLMVTNNIKTSRVVINTDYLIKDEKDILKTSTNNINYILIIKINLCFFLI